jgi:FkbM family methyltransferase
MLRSLLSLLPPNVLRFVGRLQFKVPVLRLFIEAAARRFAGADGVIKYGVGVGLRFNATGSAAGYLLGTSEIEEQELLARLLKPGHTFYDVGANVGFYSTIAARLVGPTGRVYAFEPYGPSAATAKRNAHLNGFSNVTVVQTAIGSEEGTARLDTHTGPLSTHYRIARDASHATIEVPITSIDLYAARHHLHGPNVVMIDVEGREIDVLRGMFTTLSSYRPIVMCEVHWTGDAFQRLMLRHLAELGYEASTYDGRPLPTVPSRYHALLQPRHGP